MSSSMRSLANVVLAFGPIYIPMKVYLTASPEEVGFHWQTPAGGKVKQNLVDAETEAPVAREDLLSGYEVAKDEFVTFTSEELAIVKGERTGTVLVYGFLPCEEAELSPLKVQRALYLTPDKTDKAYRLLHAVLKSTMRVAVCKWYDKGKDHLVVVSPREELLIMYNLYYACELRDMAPAFSPNSAPSEEEVALGIQLVESQAPPADFLLHAEDEYAARLRAAIALKQGGKQISSRSMSKPEPSFVTLLQKTLKQKKQH